MQRQTALSRPGTSTTRRSLWALAMLCATLAPLDAEAQFQRHFGTTGLQESGSAVAQVSDGGYFAVGTQTNTNIWTYYGYAVRTDAAGVRIWDRMFSLGPQHQATFNDTKACSNGDFIIVGSVLSQSGIWHLMAMRLDQDGSILWERMYGDNIMSYGANSVVEATLGNGVATQPGDFLIAGTASNTASERDGVLMRLTADGDLVWTRRYDVDPNATSYLVLYGVEEARVAPSAGDVIAVGDADFAGTNTDVVVLRADGASGEFGPSPQGASRFGLGANDHAFSVAEIRSGSFAGDIVTTGTSTSRAPVGWYELLMLETRPDPCNPAGQRADRFLGDASVGFDAGYCVRQITDGALGTPGDVIVTGAANRFNQINPTRALLQQFQAGTMLPVGAPLHTYGGNNGEWGYGVVERTSSYGNPGFVVTGYTRSWGVAANDNDLYLMRTNAAMAAPCLDNSYTASSAAANLGRSCLAIDPDIPPVAILCGIQSLKTEWGNDICRLSAVPPKRSMPGEEEEVTISMNDAFGATITSYPNPVREGDDVTIDYRSGAASSAEIVVSDITGRTVHTRQVEIAAGTSRLQISTEGWPAGAYLIRIAAGGATRAGHVTVIAR